MPLNPPSLTERERLLLMWGKLRRWALNTFNRDYVRLSLMRRNGECVRCGACCKLGFVCPLLERDETHSTRCVAHAGRNKNCFVFPIDESDLRDRDLVNPGTRCGYSFNGDRSRLRDHPAKMMLSPGLGRLFISKNGRRKPRNGKGKMRLQKVLARMLGSQRPASGGSGKRGSAAGK